MSDSDHMEIEFDKINEEIQKYKQLVIENPNDYEAHKELIKNQKMCQDYDVLKESRRNFFKELPLEQDIWLEWLADEKQIASTDEEKLDIVELYLNAVKDYNAVDIWVDFLDYIIEEYRDESWMPIEKVRFICGKALEMVGSNFEEGHLVWDRIKDFEILQLDKGLTSLNDVRKFFLDRLACPHNDLENTYGLYSSFESNYGAGDYSERMKVASKIVGLTRKLNEKREFKENELQNSQHSLESYFEYIDLLKRKYFKKKDWALILEIKSLYWRTIKHHFWNPLVWASFLRFLMDGNERDLDYLEFLASRAIKNSASCMVSADLWLCNLLVRELRIPSFESGSEVFSNAINVMVSVKNFDGLNEILLARFNCATRYLKFDELKQVYSSSLELQKQIPDNKDIRIGKLFAYYLSHQMKNYVAAHEIFLNITSKSRLVEDWIDWMSLSLLEGNVEKTREIFQMASRRQFGPESEAIYRSWLSFEERFGTFNSNLAASCAIFDLRRRDAKYVQSSTDFEAEEKHHDLEKAKTNTAKRQLEGFDETTAKKQKREESKVIGDISTYKVIGNSNAGSMVFLSNLPSTASRDILLTYCKPFGRVIDIILYPNQDSGELEALIEFQKVEDVRQFVLAGPFLLNGTPVTPQRCRPETLIWSYDNEEKRNTIYVKNLPGVSVVDKMMIRDHFCKYGKITDIRLQSKPSYSYAYISFEKEEEALSSLAADQSQIRPNRIVGVAISNASKKTVHNIDNKRLYISNLPDYIVETDLENFFNDCGKIQQITLNRNQSGSGYAFVFFYDDESARKGLLLNGKLLDNRVVAISVADPNKRSKDLKKGKFDSRNSKKKQDPLFVPRVTAVRQHERITIASKMGSDSREGVPLSKPKSQSDFRKMLS